LTLYVDRRPGAANRQAKSQVGPARFAPAEEGRQSRWQTGQNRLEIDPARLRQAAQCASLGERVSGKAENALEQALQERHFESAELRR